MKRLYKIFGATLLGFLLSAGLALAAVFIVPQGGTGAATFGSNAILYGNGTGAIQGSSATVGSTGAIATTIANTSNVVGLTVTQNDTTNNPKGISITNAGTNNGLYIDQNGNTGANNQTSGALVIDNTNNTGMGLQIYSDQASAVGLGSLLYVKADNASYAQPMVYLVQDGTAGSAATIRMDGPSPQIELVENDQAAPAGKFEWQVQGDRMFFNGRNSGDSGFETIMILDRLGSAQIARASFAGPVVPVASDGASLGTSSLMWSDGFFASGAVLNFNASDVLLTHSTDALTLTGGNLQVGATAVPSHSVTIASAGTGISIYNTSDQVTNYERAVLTKTSNVFTLFSENGGTGTQRSVRIGDSADYYEINPVASSGSPKFTITRSGNSTASILRMVNSGFTGSSGNQYGIQQDLTVNQTSTAGYTIYGANVTETATGSGAKNLIDLQVGSTSKFKVSNGGVGTFAGQYSTTKFTLTDGATIAVDWNNSNVQYVVIGATGRTVTFANPIDGARYILMVKQDGTGSRTITTWPATVLWAGGSAPTLTTTANKVDIIGCVYDGTNTKYYCSTSLNF